MDQNNNNVGIPKVCLAISEIVWRPFFNSTTSTMMKSAEKFSLKILLVNHRS